MRFPVRPLEGRWPSALQRAAGRFFWPDPRRLLDPDISSEEFRQLMSAVHVGGTIKITGTDRHPEADALLVEHVDLRGARVADIGASDGSTSVDLVAHLDGFASFTIADLHLKLMVARGPRWTTFFDHNDTCVLVVGRRIVAWPSLSRLMRFLFTHVIAQGHNQPQEECLLLNPRARALIARDHRVQACEHDLFTPWPGEPLDAIKVANVLRRLYFSDEHITAGLRALTASLCEGGYLLMVDNPRIAGIRCRGGLYQRHGDSLEEIATTDDAPEVADLIAAL